MLKQVQHDGIRGSAAVVPDLRPRHPGVQGRALERLHGFHEVVRRIRNLSLFAATFGMFAPWSASACMVAPFESVFHAKKPINTPLGFQAFLVVVPKIEERRRSRNEVLVTIADGQPAAFGLTKVVVRRAITSSCGSWGVTGGWAYVVGIISAERDGRLFITPLEYPDTENFSPPQ